MWKKIIVIESWNLSVRTRRNNKTTFVRAVGLREEISKQILRRDMKAGLPEYERGFTNAPLKMSVNQLTTTQDNWLNKQISVTIGTKKLTKCKLNKMN
jgi:hypothetical protein